MFRKFYKPEQCNGTVNKKMGTDVTANTSNTTTKFFGTVKWFNFNKGYGFIRCHDIKEDVFVHATSIKSNVNHKMRSLGEGESVLFNLIEGERGKAAVNVTGPNGAPVKGFPYAAMFYRNQVRPTTNNDRDRSQSNRSEAKVTGHFELRANYLQEQHFGIIRKREECFYAKNLKVYPDYYDFNKHTGHRRRITSDLKTKAIRREERDNNMPLRYLEDNYLMLKDRREKEIRIAQNFDMFSSIYGERDYRENGQETVRYESKRFGNYGDNDHINHKTGHANRNKKQTKSNSNVNQRHIYRSRIFRSRFYN